MRNVLFMKHYMFQSVTKQTPLPILIPCPEGEQHDGLANFDPAHSFAKVRLVKPKDLTLKKVRSREMSLFLECWALRDAYNRKDLSALRRRFVQLWPFFTGQDRWPSPVLRHTLGIPRPDQLHVERINEVLLTAPELANHLQKFANSKSTAATAVGTEARRAADRGDWNSVQLFLPQLVARVIEDVRLVLWYSRQAHAFIPAISCPNLKTAIFLKMLFGEIRSCPQCRRPFVPVNSNQDYCSLQHQAAYRVARWRANKKEAAQPTKKQGKAKGTAR
jgi:hypothetical protein